MIGEYRYWRCKDISCKNECLSIDRPTPIQWNNGHECDYEDITDELEKEIPDYVKDMKNITKGDG